MRENVIRLALAALAALALTACSAGGEAPSPDKAVLIYASFTPGGADQSAVERFNRTHSDVKIEIRDYWGADIEEARQGKERLLTEIAGGHMPDIIDLGLNSSVVGMLPYRKMAQKGYLEDLWSYIESDPELGREAVMEAPLRSAEVNGGLYMVFDSVGISTMAGAESQVGNRYSWSLAELRDAFVSMPEGSTVLEYSYTRSAMLYYMLCMSLDSYVDWETGQCFFDCENFRMALEFVRSFPETEDSGDSGGVSREIARRREEGLQMLSRTSLSNLYDIQICDYMFDGRASFVGYPVEDGSTGSAFTLPPTKLAMSSVCQNKEAAWDFMREILLSQYSDRQVADTPYFTFHIPVNRADYDRVIRLFRSGNFNVCHTFHPDDPPVSLHTPTKEEALRFEDFIGRVEKADLYDNDLYNIVEQTAGPYFAGDKTLDETVDLIQNRVQLYVNENR